MADGGKQKVQEVPQIAFGTLQVGDRRSPPRAENPLGLNHVDSPPQMSGAYGTNLGPSMPPYR
jgi:hypothetical protein